MTVTINGTTGVAGVDGTASTPAIQGNDTNTGIFFPAADTIAFAEGGAEVARFDSSGNLGIGTSSPNNVMTTYRGSGVSNYIQFTNATTGTTSTDGCLIGVAADDTALRLRVLEAAPMIFTTSDTERMRIDSSGTLRIGTTTTAYNTGERLSVVSSGAGAGTTGIGFRGTNGELIGMWNSTVGSSTLIAFATGTGGSGVGNITTNGTGVTYGTNSDYRLKENIAPMTGALAKVSALKPVTYTWKVDGSDGQGFIAHELAEIVPDCVIGEKDAVKTVDELDENGKVVGTKEVPKYQGIDTSFLVATLTAAIQEQQAIITDLKARIETLENK